MATKKASSAAKKTVKKSAPSKPTTTTKVTTVKAVESRPVAAAKPSRRGVSALRSSTIAALIAEFIGTFILTAVFIVSKGEPLYVGFALVAIVLTVGALSGAHINPLLTVGAWVTRKIGSLRAVGYLVAQVLGSVAALGLLTAFISGAPGEVSAQAQMYGQSAPALFVLAELAGGKEWYVFFAELVGATIFAFAVASAWSDRRDRTATAFNFGLGFFVAALIAGVAASFVSANAVLNPAVALAVNAIDWSKIHLIGVASYLIAPLIGGVLGFALSDALRSVKVKDEI